jgi:hypothetical protein
VKATDEERVPLWKDIIEKGYPSLFEPSAHLTTMTAGQFDEHMRTQFGVQGSTVDKIAAFFIAAAKVAGIPISAHLLARKPVSTSSSSKKSAKQRKNGERSDAEDEEEDRLPPAAPAKALEYQLIDLMSEPDVDEGVKTSIWALVQYLMARKKKTEKATTS